MEKSLQLSEARLADMTKELRNSKPTPKEEDRESGSEGIIIEEADGEANIDISNLFDLGLSQGAVLEIALENAGDEASEE